ncbi:MAG: hypothetical protein O7J95_19090, partial [Planctomycetota bacterium]|nr:hypothetical protein [Planctomycetota bacterium]
MLRPASFPHGLVFVLFAGAMLTSSCGPAQPLRNPEQRAGDGSSSDDVAAEVRALESRVEELEKSLRAIEATAPAGTARLPDVATLFEILGRLDGPAMFRTLETLLLSGEDGFSVIHQFLHEADLDRPRILTLTHDPQLVFGLLRLVGLHVAEVAELSAYLMDATARRPQSFIRREIFNFLPVFLNHHRGRFPELRRRLEEDIVQQLEMGGDYLYKVSLAIRDLEFQPPVEPLEGILRDPARAENHGTICDYLARGGPDG